MNTKHLINLNIQASLFQGFSCMMHWDSCKNPSWEILPISKMWYRSHSQRNEDMNECSGLYHCYMQLRFPCVFSRFFRVLDISAFSFGCFNLVMLCSSSINESLLCSTNSAFHGLHWKFYSFSAVFTSFAIFWNEFILYIYIKSFFLLSLST